MIRRIGPRQFMEWQAYWRLEPFGDEWRQAAMIASASLAPHSKRPLDPEEFLPSRPVAGQSDEEQRALFRRALGQRDQRGE